MTFKRLRLWVGRLDLTSMSLRLLERLEAIRGGNVNVSVHRLEEART